MKFVRYNATLKNEWNEFLKNSKNGLFMFNRDYMDYHSDRFTDHSLLAYNDKDKLIALLPANETDGVLYSHQGLTFGSFVTANSMKVSVMVSLFDDLKAYVFKQGLSKIVYKATPYIYHKQPSQEDLYALQQCGAKVSRVDVSTTVNLEDKISFASLRKRGVKKAAKNDVVVKQSQNFKSYMDMLSSVLEAQHETTPVHSVEEIELLASRFPNSIKLFVAEKDASIMAGVIVFEYDNVVHAQYICASSEGRDIGALDAVFSYLINDTYSAMKFFDFGISTEKAGTVLNEGLIAQKEGFGGRGVVHQFFEIDLG